MKKRILAALLAAVILLTLAGCANNKADAPAPDTTRPTVTTTVETTGTAESDTDTEHTEEKKNSTAEETKPAETTKTQEPSESVTEQTETKPAATKPQTTEKPESESKPAPFDIDHWNAYAKSYAESKGLVLSNTAVDCWDNPIRAGAHCIYIERDIQSRLDRYAKDEDITDVWIWAEAMGNDRYDIYIGYA